MMARSKCSNQRPDTLMQDRSPPARRNHLQRAAGPYMWVKSRHFGDVRATSASPLKADIDRKGRHVSKVPTPEVRQRHCGVLLCGDHRFTSEPAIDRYELPIQLFGSRAQSRGAGPPSSSLLHLGLILSRRMAGADI